MSSEKDKSELKVYNSKVKSFLKNLLKSLHKLYSSNHPNNILDNLADTKIFCNVWLKNTAIVFFFSNTFLYL